MLSFSEYCQLYSQAEFELLDWQRKTLDRFYERFEERKRNGEPMVLNAPRKSGKTSFELELLIQLIGYCNYLRKRERI
jgi:hypothetical protein